MIEDWKKEQEFDFIKHDDIYNYRGACRYRFPEIPPRAAYIVSPHEGLEPMRSVFFHNFNNFDTLREYLKDIEKEIKVPDYHEYIDPVTGYDIKCH